MRKLLVLAVLALAIASGITAVSSFAASDGNCSMSGSNMWIDNFGTGKPRVHYQVSCSDNSGWAVTAWCSKSTDGGSTWAQCANTNKVTNFGNGDESVTDPVGNGSWGCVTGTLYRARAEFGNASIASGPVTPIC